jgi:hypothetical protein
MKDAIGPSHKDNHSVPRLLQELAPPALPTDGFTPHGFLLTLQAIGGGQHEHQQRAHHMHPHRSVMFLRGMTQVPLLFGGLDAAVLDEAAIIIVIKRPQGCVHRGVGQEHRVAPWAIVPTIPLAHHHGIDRVGLEGPAVVVTPLLNCAIVVVGGQPSDPDHLRLQSFGPGRFALAVADGVHPTADRDPFPRCRLRPGIRRHRHVRFRGRDIHDPMLV